MGQLEVQEDGDDYGRIGEEGEDPHGATARGAEQRQHLVDAREQRSKEDGLLSYWPSNNSMRSCASRLPIPLRDTNVAKCFPLGLVLPLSQL